MPTKENAMSDDLKNRGPADAARINIHEDYEVRYWTRELGISEEKLRETVARVGVMSADVRKALGK
jgi:uncharacterized protein DUF3606